MMIYTPSEATQLLLADEQIPGKRSRTVSNASILDVAENAGILLLNPSDLVFESGVARITYYDFVISAARQTDGSYQLYLSKFDNDTNLEWMEFADVTGDVMASYGLPDSDLPMILLGVLTWKAKIQKCKILCLTKAMDIDSTQALEALKRAAEKFRCLHHVVSISGRKLSSESHDLSPRRSRSRSPQDGMRLRVMMCQSRTQIELPAQALREARCLLFPGSHPLLCLCFPLT